MNIIYTFFWICVLICGLIKCTPNEMLDWANYFLAVSTLIGICLIDVLTSYSKKKRKVS